MADYADLSARLFSWILKVCETAPVGGGKEGAAGDAAAIGSSVVQAGLPPAGEALPLVLAVAVFIAAGAMILSRVERRNSSSRDAAAQASAQRASALIR